MTLFFKRRVHTLWVLVCVMVLAGFAACNKTGGGSSSAASSGALSANISGELTVMMWSGDNVYYPDIGSMNLTQDDLFAQNVAACYATAKEFNKIYPNVKINFFAKSGGDKDDLPWEQARENFRMEYGKLPDIYAANDVTGDAQKGLIADLSIFADDPMFKSFNPGVMALSNFEGRQFAVPQYLIPWAVYINKSLAEANNIDVPDPDWTIAEYTRFIGHSRPNEFYGSMGGYNVDQRLVETGTGDYSYMLLNHKPGEPFVNINSEPVRSLLRYTSQWAANAVWPNSDQGKIAGEFMDEHWWWGYKFFIEGKLLTYADDPWMMGDAAHPDTVNHWGAVRAADWDIYPRPSTDYMPNTIGVVMDPMVIHNYAMDDGNPQLNAEEEAKLRLAWEFMKFWCGDTRAWEARARQLFNDGETYKSCMNDSFPMITGPEFSKQMEIWYMPDHHKRYADKNKMPGFQAVLELWEKGQMWEVSDKVYPWFYDFEGDRRPIPYEWENAWNAEVTGAERFDPNWLDQVYARLPGWNSAMNQRWETETRRLQEALNRYYPK